MGSAPYQFPDSDLLTALTDLYFDNHNVFIPLLHRLMFERALMDGYEQTYFASAYTQIVSGCISGTEGLAPLCWVFARALLASLMTRVFYSTAMAIYGTPPAGRSARFLYM